MQPVLVQVCERNIVTYNRANDSANQVQIGLGGDIIWDGFTKAQALATPTPVPTPTKPPEATPTSEAQLPNVDLSYNDINGIRHQTIYIPQNKETETHIVIDDPSNLSQLLGLINRPIQSQIKFKLDLGGSIGNNQEIGNGHRSKEFNYNLGNGGKLSFVAYYDLNENFVLQIHDVAQFSQYMNEPDLYHNIKEATTGFILKGLVGDGINPPVAVGEKPGQIIDSNKWHQLYSNPQLHYVIK